MKYKYPHNQAEIDANEWEPIDQARADYLLECLPPAKWKKNAFMVGEALCHLWDTGQVVYDTVVTINGHNFAKPNTADSFDPDKYTAEIQAQLQTIVVNELPAPTYPEPLASADATFRVIPTAIQIETNAPYEFDGNPTFKQWMMQVDLCLIGAIGLSSADLPDVCYRDWYEDRLNYVHAANRALAYAQDMPENI